MRETDLWESRRDIVFNSVSFHDVVKTELALTEKRVSPREGGAVAREDGREERKDKNRNKDKDKDKNRSAGRREDG